MSVRESTGFHNWPVYAMRLGWKAWKAMSEGKLREPAVVEPLPWAESGYGWGGHEYFGTPPGCDNTPIIFVRGNCSSANDWDGHAEYFLGRGYKGDELWAVEFPQSSPTHAQMAQRLESFVSRVRRYTGAEKVNIVAHSLGVTGVRYWMAAWDRFEWVENFVALAGANHGTVVNQLLPIADGDRIASVIGVNPDGTPRKPLRELNQMGETPGEVNYYTIRGLFDEYFMLKPLSPELRGATNVALPCDHTGVRDSEDTLNYLNRWLNNE